MVSRIAELRRMQENGRIDRTITLEEMLEKEIEPKQDRKINSTPLGMIPLYKEGK